MEADNKINQTNKNTADLEKKLDSLRGEQEDLPSRLDELLKEIDDKFKRFELNLESLNSLLNSPKTKTIIRTVGYIDLALNAPEYMEIIATYMTTLKGGNYNYYGYEYDYRPDAPVVALESTAEKVVNNTINIPKAGLEKIVDEVEFLVEKGVREFNKIWGIFHR